MVKNKGFCTVVLLFYMFVWLVLVPSKRKGLSSLYCLTEKKKKGVKFMKVRNLTSNVVHLVGHLVHCFSKSR